MNFVNSRNPAATKNPMSTWRAAKMMTPPTRPNTPTTTFLTSHLLVKIYVQQGSESSIIFVIRYVSLLTNYRAVPVRVVREALKMEADTLKSCRPGPGVSRRLQVETGGLNTYDVETLPYPETIQL